MVRSPSMAWLERIGANHRVTLPARCLVGRGPECLLKTQDRRVSGEHARIAWTGERWELRDLGSRNGTFVNESRLEAGVSTPLAVGDALGFGGPEPVWRFADAGAPLAFARALEGGHNRAAEDGLLVLPDADNPRVCVFEDFQQGWVVEAEDATRSVSDCEVLTVEGQAWMLHLPMTLEATAEVGEDTPVFAGVELVFEVSRDEEDIGMQVLHRGRELVRGARNHHQLLLLLARARLEDAADGSAPPAEQGWRYVEDVCAALQIEDLRLNTEIYRARKELAPHVQGGAGLVERRRASRSLRLGTGRVRLV